MEILYEDNHIIALNKKVSELVQGDKTGDISLDIQVKDYLKKKCHKQGNVFLGVVHRLDRPASGVLLFARTGKALTRLNDLFRNNEINKKYWAIVKNKPSSRSGLLTHYLVRNQDQNKSYAYDKLVPNSKEARLRYEIHARSDRYFLLEIDLYTGRHHQIRCQLSKINCPVKGDLKYGYERSNTDSGISLHAREIRFIHPVKKEPLHIIAPVPDERLWKIFEDMKGRT
ncbi:Ribosomal large subunit pseudouridine synthase C [subsurface metagenome]